MEISERTRKSYKEIYRILEHSSITIRTKIPKKFINTIYKIMDKTYEPQIDYFQDVNNQNLMPETYAMMALIYRDFICDKSKQKILFEKEKKERQRIKEAKKEKYNLNNIFANQENLSTDKSINNSTNQNYMIKEENKFIRNIRKIKEIIFNIFNKK